MVSRDDFDFEWLRFLGAEPVEMSEGRSVMRLAPKTVHLNQNGTVNGTILFGLAEVAGAAAVVAGMAEQLSTCYVAVKSATIDYLAPAAGIVTATGAADRAALASARDDVANGMPADVEAVVEVTDPAGRAAARVRLTVALRQHRGPPGSSGA